MRGSSFGYLLSEGFRNIYQHRNISFAAIGVLVACLLLVGASILLAVNLNSLVGYMESQNEVVIFLDEDVDEEELTRIDEELNSIENISSITFISKDEGLSEWMEDLGDDGTLLDWLVDDNPLPHSYRIIVENVETMAQTLDEVSAIDGVDSISSSPEVISAISNLKQGINVCSGAVIVILAVVSVVIVANTIRATVFNRRREINIMKYVGATDTFIRMPFLMEGMLLGIISALLATFLLWIGYSALINWMASGGQAWAEMLYHQLVPFTDVAGTLLLRFIVVGGGIGAIGSGFYVGKYLKV